MESNVARDRVASAVHGNTRETLIGHLTLVAGTDPELVHDDASLEHDLGADSLAVVEVVFGLEERYAVRFPDDAVRQVRTFGDLLAVVDAAV